MDAERAVRPNLLSLVQCPTCRDRIKESRAEAGRKSTELVCGSCGHCVPIIHGIPRFVPADNYANNFGFQWNRFRQTQLDSHARTHISRDRLYETTGWDWRDMEGKRVLDAGCGAGRFAEIALEAGAQVTCLDYSTAIDAAAQNLSRFPGFQAVQASILEPPFMEGAFDYVYCLGVLQHTPDPQRSFERLVRQVAPGGAIAVDVYARTLKNVLWPKYWLRPITKRMSQDRLLRAVEAWVPLSLPVSRCVGRIPVVGRWLKWAIPVANYEGVHPLSEVQLKEWAVLDTFDMLSPKHDHPQSIATVRAWCAEAGLVDVEVFRKGHVIARGRRPHRSPSLASASADLRV